MKGSCHVLSLGSPPSLSCPLLSIPRGVRATGWHTHGLEAQLGGRLGSSLPEQRLMEPLQFALILILMHTSFFLGRESIPFTRSSRVSRSLKCLNHRYIWRDKLFATFHEHLLCAGQELRDSSNSTSAKKCLIKKKKKFFETQNALHPERIQLDESEDTHLRNHCHNLRHELTHHFRKFPLLLVVIL